MERMRQAKSWSGLALELGYGKNWLTNLSKTDGIRLSNLIQCMRLLNLNVREIILALDFPKQFLKTLNIKELPTPKEDKIYYIKRGESYYVGDGYIEEGYGFKRKIFKLGKDKHGACVFEDKQQAYQLSSRLKGSYVVEVLK